MFISEQFSVAFANLTNNCLEMEKIIKMCQLFDKQDVKITDRELRPTRHSLEFIYRFLFLNIPFFSFQKRLASYIIIMSTEHNKPKNVATPVNQGTQSLQSAINSFSN